MPDTTPKQEQSNLGSGTRPGENADASKIRKEPKVYAHGGVSYDPRRDDPMEQPEGDPTPSSSAVPKHMQQRQDPRLLNKRRCPDLQVPAKGHRMAGKGKQTSYINDPQISGDGSQSSQTPINPSSSDKGKGRKEAPKVQDEWDHYREGQKSHYFLEENT